MMRSADRPRQEHGFTLVEVLVALVVSGFLLAIVLDGAATGRQRGKAMAEKRMAIFLADGLISEAALKPYGEVSGKGESEGLSWSLDESVLSSDPRGTAALVSIAAVVSDRQGHQLFSAKLRRIKALGH